MGLLLATVAVTLVVQGPFAAQPRRISGIVVEESTHLGVAGARVVVGPADESSAPPNRVPETITDAEGRYAFSDIAPGHYRVSAHKEGFALPVNETVMPVIDLIAGEEVTDVVVTVQRAGIVSGSVLTPSGEPMMNATVNALLKRLDVAGVPANSRDHAAAAASDGPPILMPLGSAATDDRGEFRIDNLPAGDYVVAALADPADARSSGAGTTYYPGTTDEAAADAVSVQTGRITAHVDVRLAIVQTYQVSGVVVDAAGVPVADATVILMPDIRNDASLTSFVTGAHSAVQADANGVFVINRIPAGAYIIESPTGDDGAFGATSRSVVIDDGGRPLAGRQRTDAALGPETIAITITGANVSDIRLIVKKP